MHASLHLIGQYQATIRIQREKKADQSPINRASLKTVLYHWFGYCFKLGSIQHYKGDYWKSANTTRSNLHAALKADPDDTDTTTTCARGTSSLTAGDTDGSKSPASALLCFKPLPPLMTSRQASIRCAPPLDRTACSVSTAHASHPLPFNGVWRKKGKIHLAVGYKETAVSLSISGPLCWGPGVALSTETVERGGRGWVVSQNCLLISPSY